VSSSEILAEGQGLVRYDAELVLVETRLSAELALRSWLAVGLALPYRVVDVGVGYRDPTTGAPVTSQQAGSTRAMSGCTASAILRSMSTGRASSAHCGSTRGSARPCARQHRGGSVPARSDRPGAPARAVRDRDLDPVPRRRGAAFAGPVTAAAWGIAQLSLYDNDHGFRAGDRYSGG